MSKKEESSNPWWKEPWPWILMAGPAVAIIGCAITIVLALDGFGNEPVHDGGVKQGLVVLKGNPDAQLESEPSKADTTSVE